MQASNDADFEIEVKFESRLLQRFQLQGIIVEQSGTDYLRFDFNSDGSVTKAFAASIAGGTPTTRISLTIGANGASPQYMRVKREGNLWTQSYSLDGTVWTIAGTFTHLLAVDSVGTFAGNTGTTIPAHTAKIDYFFNTRSPIVPEDGGIAPDPLPPVLSSILVVPTATSAAVTWETDEPASSAVSYGLTPAHELGTVSNPARTRSHTIMLTGLTPFTAYRYRITSTDSSGNSALSPDSGFTTLSTSIIVSDDFNTQVLNPVWTFVNPLSDAGFALANFHTDSAWAVVTVPGGIAHDIWTTGRNAPRLMQPANNVDFEVEAKYDSRVTQRYQMQGVLVESGFRKFHPVRCELRRQHNESVRGNFRRRDPDNPD